MAPPWQPWHCSMFNDPMVEKGQERVNNKKRGCCEMPDLYLWLLDQYAELAAAMQFLTILSLPGPTQHFKTGTDTTSSSPRLVLGSGYFSLVGLLLGLLLALLLLLLDPLLPQLAVA